MTKSTAKAVLFYFGRSKPLPYRSVYRRNVDRGLRGGGSKPLPYRGVCRRKVDRGLRGGEDVAPYGFVHPPIITP